MTVSESPLGGSKILEIRWYYLPKDVGGFRMFELMVPSRAYGWETYPSLVYFSFSFLNLIDKKLQVSHFLNYFSFLQSRYTTSSSKVIRIDSSDCCFFTCAIKVIPKIFPQFKLRVGGSASNTGFYSVFFVGKALRKRFRNPRLDFGFYQFQLRQFHFGIYFFLAWHVLATKSKILCWKNNRTGFFSSTFISVKSLSWHPCNYGSSKCRNEK